MSVTFLIWLLGSTSPVDAQQPGWSTTGSPASGRNAGQRAVLLANGKVLVVGPGSFGSGNPRPELYDPATGQWSVTGSMITPRSRPVLLRLGNGKVLAAGGAGDTSAEVYDPDIGTWSATGSLSIARLTPAGVLLADGRVLITGGTTSTIAELYDPATGVWSFAGTMTAIHSGGSRPDAQEHTSTLLPDGRVLVVGGSAELYDPAIGSWTATGNLNTPRFNHTATLLQNGKVLVTAGSVIFGACPAPSDTAELYDPATGQWSAASRLTTPRNSPKAILLPNGKVLVVGGGGTDPSCFPLASSELYDPTTGDWRAIGSLNSATIPLQAVLLANGKVLAIGGNGSGAELFDSGTDSYALPQFVFGGGWSTALYFSNTTGAAASLQVNFFSNDGAPLSVPLNGIGSVSARTISLGPGGTVILEAPDGGDLVAGWAEATLPVGMIGYAVVRQSIPGRPDQEAVLPLTTESSQTADFAYDDVNFTTSMAFLNPTNQEATATSTVYRADGAQVGFTQVVLGPHSKQATVVQNLPGLAGSAGNRGWISFSVTKGAISVLGIRSGEAAFTSIPVTHKSGTVISSTGSVLPQLAFGAGWYTAIYFSNTTNSPVSFPVSFFGDGGAPLEVPLKGIGPVSVQTVNLNSRSTVILEAPNSGTLVQGWGATSQPPGVVGYAVFRQSVEGRSDQEAIVSLVPESGRTSDLIYDDTAYTTAFTLTNPGKNQNTIKVTVYGVDGSQTGFSQMTLGPASKTAAILRNLPGLAAIAGSRGRVTFSSDSGPFSVLGLRFGVQAFTSIPVNQR